MMTDPRPTSLDQLWQQLAADPAIERQRQASGASRLVVGEGPAPAPLMLIGEAPGRNEDRLGRPFVGQAGQLLDKTLSEVGLDRGQLYITNLVKFRPAGNRDPQPDEIAAASAYLRAELELVRPRLVGCLGRHAARHFLPAVSMGADNGRAIVAKTPLTGDEPVTIVPCYHPAACLYNPGLLASFKSALAGLQQQLSHKAETRRPLQTKLI